MEVDGNIYGSRLQKPNSVEDGVDEYVSEGPHHRNLIPHLRPCYQKRTVQPAEQQGLNNPMG